MKNRGFVDLIVVGIIGVALLVGASVAYFGIKQPTQQFGATFNPSGGGTYRLQSSIGTANTSIRLTSFKEPVSNLKYTMAYLNTDVAYGTISPQSSISEFVSFTGITQNADGSATLTGVSRGMGRSYPYTASTTLAQAHPGQSIFILSDSPQLFNEYVTKSNAETISGIKTFSVSPIAPTPTTATQVAIKSYVDGVALVSAPNADEVTKGVVELATGAEAAAGTSSGSAARLVLPASSANATPSAAIIIPVTNGSGKLAQGFLDLAQAFTWTGTQTFNATTTLAGSSLTNNALVINSKAYQFPSSYGTAATSTLTSTPTGTLKWSTGTNRIATLTSTVTIVSTTATSTVFSFSIPANELGTNNIIRTTSYIIGFGVDAGQTIAIALDYGGKTVAYSKTTATSNPQSDNGGYINTFLMNSGATNTQLGAFQLSSLPNILLNSGTTAAVGNIGAYGTAAVDSTAAQTLTLSIKFSNAGAGSQLISIFTIIEKIAN